MSSSNGQHVEQNSTNGSVMHLDAVIVGAGFGGCYFLHALRKRGYKVKLIDALDGFGGTWRANWYPGARVDCEMPYYLLSAPELMQDWTWTERFPGGDELRRYFDYVDKKWDLSKDSYLNTRVTESRYSESDRLWYVKTSTGLQLSCRWFLPATGTSHKQHIPKWPGMSSFRGELYHPASWPREDPVGMLKGKRVAVIGAGSSAVQIMQEAAKQASHVVQFLRTPNQAVPMRQRSVSPEEVEKIRPTIPSLIEYVRSTNQGLPFEMSAGKTSDYSPEERERVWGANWEHGGFKWGGSSFADVLLDETSNRLAYDFWARNVRARIPDPAKRDILAPLEPPYYVNTKRPSMEQDYYEMVSLPHVDIVNTPIESYDESGIITSDGKHRNFDLVAVATGYDAVTGTLKQMNIIGRDSMSISDKWSNGVVTQLGMTIHGFPNMFFVYGPQAPTSLTSGPPFIEQQVEWVCEVIDRASKEGWDTVEATKEAEDEWAALNSAIAGKTLVVQTDSWWMGANVPGKQREMLIFPGGMKLYFQKCQEALDGMKGFACTKHVA